MLIRRSEYVRLIEHAGPRSLNGSLRTAVVRGPLHRGSSGYEPPGPAGPRRTRSEPEQFVWWIMTLVIIAITVKNYNKEKIEVVALVSSVIDVKAYLTFILLPAQIKKN